MAAVTRPNLNTVIDTQFADNGNRAITAEKARIVCRAIVESCLVLLSDDYVDVTELNAAIAALIGSAAPGYDTLGELQTIIDNNATARYTKTEMQTGGQAQLHWNNLTNVPSNNLTPEIGEVRINLNGYPMSSATSGDIFNNSNGRGYGKYDKWAILGMSYAGGINAAWGTGAGKRFLGIHDASASDGWQILSGNVGANTHTLLETEMPSHTHTAKSRAGSSSGAPAIAFNPGDAGDPAQPVTLNSISVQNTGGGQPHNNIPATLIAQFIVRVIA